MRAGGPSLSWRRPPLAPALPRASPFAWLLPARSLLAAGFGGTGGLTCAVGRYGASSDSAWACLRSRGYWFGQAAVPGLPRQLAARWAGPLGSCWQVPLADTVRSPGGLGARRHLGCGSTLGRPAGRLLAGTVGRYGTFSGRALGARRGRGCFAARGLSVGAALGAVFLLAFSWGFGRIRLALVSRHVLLGTHQHSSARFFA